MAFARWTINSKFVFNSSKGKDLNLLIQWNPAALWPMKTSIFSMEISKQRAQSLRLNCSQWFCFECKREYRRQLSRNQSPGEHYNCWISRLINCSHQKYRQLNWGFMSIFAFTVYSIISSFIINLMLFPIDWQFITLSHDVMTVFSESIKSSSNFSTVLTLLVRLLTTTCMQLGAHSSHEKWITPGKHLR